MIAETLLNSPSAERTGFVVTVKASFSLLLPRGLLTCLLRDEI